MLRVAIGRSRPIRRLALALVGPALVALLLSTVAGRPAPVAAQIPGGLNATLTASPTSAAAGQVVTFSYSARPPAVAPPFPFIASLQIDYGDGQSDQLGGGGGGQPVNGTTTHVYSSSGFYTATLSAISSNGGSGSATASVNVSGGGGGSLSVNINASPATVNVGQTVNLSYSITTSFGIGFPQVRSILISWGDGAPLPLPSSQPNGTVPHTYNSPGTYTITMTATDSTGGQGQDTAFVQVLQGGTSGQPPVNVQILNPPFTGQVGQTLGFSAATAQAVNTGAAIQSYTWSYGDGGTDSGQTVRHAWGSPGTYTVTLTVTDTTGASTQTSTQITISSNTPPPQPGVSVTLQAGWNLVAVPNGATLPSPLGPLYTFQPGDTAYQTPQNTQAGLGYWAYYSSPATESIPLNGPQTVTRSLPSGQFVMIGNPGNGAATVSGADIVYTYNAAAGYQATTLLQPGQGAWAFSNNGGTVTISASSS